MKITDVRTAISSFGFRNCIFVMVHTDEGITGIGEVVYKRKDMMVEAGIQELRRYLVGKDPTNIEDHFEKMYRDAFLVGGALQTAPMGAIEIAMWDILGKSLNAPIYKLLGGKCRDRIPVYCHCRCGPSPETFVENINGCVRRGYRAIKTTLPLFYGGNAEVSIDNSKGHHFGYSGTGGMIPPCHKETELLAPDVFKRIAEYFLAAREAVGPEVHLMVDCHGRLSPANARRLLRELESANLTFVEEPVPAENAAALREVVRESPIPIATGERWSTVYDAQRFLRENAVHIAQPDVVYCGGIAQTKKIAALCEAQYVPIAPHNPNGPIATMASLHVAAAVPNFLMLETIGSVEDLELADEFIEPGYQLADGQMLLPDRPGLGVTFNESACGRHPYQPFKGWR
ncbi:MAG: mandelate racemase/muconate lactonizing enzyme family protein [Phycisphaeraceae bacterium]|nr:mandelate racemase/muconate lactonizing enzyme family protein [Phycisphaeraceae bacterium]